MSKQYQPKSFFRQSPNRFLQQYFAAHNVLMDIDFGALSETQIDTINDAWLALPEETRKAMEMEEHQPAGATEAHLVEELAGIIWRKRRVMHRASYRRRHHSSLVYPEMAPTCGN